jgi:hypothetical protein
MIKEFTPSYGLDPVKVRETLGYMTELHSELLDRQPKPVQAVFRRLGLIYKDPTP